MSWPLPELRNGFGSELVSPMRARYGRHVLLTGAFTGAKHIFMMQHHQFYWESWDEQDDAVGTVEVRQMKKVRPLPGQVALSEALQAHKAEGLRLR